MVWGDGDTVTDPSGTTYPASNQVENGAMEQMGDADSLYNYYKRLIMIRKANPAIARGEYQALSLPNTKVGGFIATWEGETVCVLHNTTLNEVQLDPVAISAGLMPEISASVGQGEATLEPGTLTIPAQTSVVLRLFPGED